MMLSVRHLDSDSRTLNEDPIQSLIYDLGSPDILTCKEARESLAALGKSVVPALIYALNAPNEQTRMESARVLGIIRDPAAASALIRALQDENSVVRWTASYALAALGHDGLLPLLHALIMQPDSIWLRRGAHRVFTAEGERAFGSVLRPVIEAIEDVEPTLEVPIAAVNALHALEEK